MTIGLGLASFSIANADYVDAYKQFNVGQYGGTYENAKGFTGTYGGNGYLSKKSTIIVDSYGAKKLSKVYISTTVYSGKPYYQHLFAESTQGAVIRYYFNDKFLKTNPTVTWTPSPSFGNIMSTTCYIMSDYAEAGSDIGTQYRYVTIFKY
ncbi:hypothetical protein [Bacillus sp. AFS055030]|uniref:hypothetical protein n=1 Tax=Bacillus sp. AFS055030 TaxID=2033507 RepID=UPI001155D6D5|nr:hypothetical protein [Bacillus sp. AFS055030]